MGMYTTVLFRTILGLPFWGRQHNSEKTTMAIFLKFRSVTNPKKNYNSHISEIENNHKSENSTTYIARAFSSKKLKNPK